jgi:hypothetical protein
VCSRFSWLQIGTGECGDKLSDSNATELVVSQVVLPGFLTIILCTFLVQIVSPKTKVLYNIHTKL